MIDFRVVAFCVASFALVGVAPSLPPAPPDGTYTYSVTGSPTVTSTTVVLVTKDGRLSVVEHPAISGIDVATETDYDRATLLPVEYRAAVGPETTVVSISGDTATLLEPKTSRTKIPGTKGLMLSDGLAGSSLMMPSIVAAVGTPMTDLALNGFLLVRVDAVAAADTRPAGVPANDVEKAFVATVGPRLMVWSNPETHVVDRMQGGRATFTLTAHTNDTAVSTPAPPSPAPAPYPTPVPRFSSRSVSFSSANGATLAGTLTVPDGAKKPLPAIVFVHGSGAATRDGGVTANPTFLDLSNALSNAGFIVLRYDKRGIGESTGTATEDWHVLAKDVQAAAAFLRLQPEVDPHGIILLGHSEGGLVVPLAASGVPGLAGIILMAPPAIPMQKLMAEQALRVPPSMRAGLDRSFAGYAGIDPAALIAQIKVPILVVQGGRDLQVLPADLPHLVDAARASHRAITVVTLPEDDHIFLRLNPSQPDDFSEYNIAAPIDPRVAPAIVTWLRALGITDL